MRRESSRPRKCPSPSLTLALRRLRQAQEKEHTITFKNADHVGDLSQYGGDVELKETKRLIHAEKEKWYLAPDEVSEHHQLLFHFIFLRPSSPRRATT